jgi:hypothetical protein
MLTKETIDLIGAFKSPIIELTKDIKNEVTFFLDNGVSDYVNSMTEKFGSTKTFLFRNEKVSFYDVYFPISLEINDKRLKANTIEDLFEGKNNCVTIIGNAGSGKSMLLKHLFLSAVKTLYKVPIVVELRSLNDFEGDLTEFLYKVIFNNRLTPNKKILERILSSGSFVFLLDGYDEIYSTHKIKITNDLDSFIDRYFKNDYIISSRPDSGIESLPRFNNFEIQGLNHNEIFKFIDLQLKDHELHPLAIKIKDTIKKPENQDYKNFLGSPLLLSMFILTFNSYPELPKKKSKFYWNVFDTLASKHDTFTKHGGFQHERKTGLLNEDFEAILKWLSYITLFEGKYSFDKEYLTNKLEEIKQNFKLKISIQDLIEDLCLAISIIIIDGFEYRFPHKSMQEYFCASLIKDQSPDIKEKIYGVKFKQVLSKTVGGNENLWSLSYEMDKIPFIKYFILPHLENIAKKLNAKSELGVVKQVFHLTGSGDGIDLTQNGFEFSSYFLSGGIEMVLLRFLDLANFETFSLRNFLTPENQTLFDGFFLNPKHHNEGELDDIEINYFNVWCTELEKFLQEIGMVKYVVNKADEIKNKIKELKSVIKEEDKSNLTLLKIK